MHGVRKYSCMGIFLSIVALLGLFFNLVECQKSGRIADGALYNETTDTNFLPSVMIAMLVRNKGHNLPYVLSLIEKLDYPRDRLSIW